MIFAWRQSNILKTNFVCGAVIWRRRCPARSSRTSCLRVRRLTTTTTRRCTLLTSRANVRPNASSRCSSRNVLSSTASCERQHAPMHFLNFLFCGQFDDKDDTSSCVLFQYVVNIFWYIGRLLLNTIRITFKQIHLLVFFLKALTSPIYILYYNNNTIWIFFCSYRILNCSIIWMPF